MSCVAAKGSTVWRRRASAAGRGLRGLSRICSAESRIGFPRYARDVRHKAGETMAIKKVGVLGCGLMGSGIAQVCATAGFDVVVLEADQKFIDKGFSGIDKSLARFAEKPEKSGITPEKAKETRGRLKGTLNKQDLA